MRGASGDKPAAGRRRRSQRPGFSYQVRLIGGVAARRLEREQAEASAEALRRLAANRDPATLGAAQAVTQTGSGPVRPADADPSPGQQAVGWPYPPEVRAHAVGLVGVGRPVREVARLVGVHPATVRRWVRQAMRRWAELVDAVDTHNKRCTDPDTDTG